MRNREKQQIKSNLRTVVKVGALMFVAGLVLIVAFVAFVAISAS